LLVARIFGGVWIERLSVAMPEFAAR